jgi:protease I
MKKKQILILVADNYEDLELHYPRLRLIEAGREVKIAGEKKGHPYTSKHGYEATADLSFDEVSTDDYDALIIPGGYAPDTLRVIPKVLEIVREFNNQKKLIAFICHAGWVPASANILKDISCTSYKTIKDDVINAGAKWVDKEVVVDKHFISSRNPNDLPKFCEAIIKYLNKE